ncbi:MAG: c-type cytochrome, partial [Planctomycetota bacterium]
HKDGDMVGFVQGDLQDADTWKPADIEAVIAAMATESGLGDPKTPPAVIELGRDHVSNQERCGACHRFRDNGTDLGTACDLTGWGGREWLVGIIADPTHERFYGETNDRMPSFGKAAEGSVPRLTNEQIGLIADWLRGEW